MWEAICSADTRWMPVRALLEAAPWKPVLPEVPCPPQVLRFALWGQTRHSSPSGPRSAWKSSPRPGALVVGLPCPLKPRAVGFAHHWTQRASMVLNPRTRWRDQIKQTRSPSSFLKYSKYPKGDDFQISPCGSVPGRSTVCCWASQYTGNQMSHTCL